MKLKNQSESLAEDEDTALDDVESKVRSSVPRVLAVTHSNGAADVLLQALLDNTLSSMKLCICIVARVIILSCPNFC